MALCTASYLIFVTYEAKLLIPNKPYFKMLPHLIYICFCVHCNYTTPILMFMNKSVQLFVNILAIKCINKVELVVIQYSVSVTISITSKAFRSSASHRPHLSKFSNTITRTPSSMRSTSQAPLCEVVMTHITVRQPVANNEMNTVEHTCMHVIYVCI